MTLLAEFTVIRPAVGLLVWTTVIFGIFWFLASKFAFGPIADALEERDDNIQKALEEAKKAKAEMESFKDDNAKILGEARAEQSAIMKEARVAKDAVINEAKDNAKVDANKIIASAQTEINAEKVKALAELKKDSGIFALAIAEKLIKKQLMGNDDERNYANGLIDDIKLN